jgi:hypothetical protein
LKDLLIRSPSQNLWLQANTLAIGWVDLRDLTGEGVGAWVRG